jgi:N-acetyl-anhydromuramyl-L-alanine amidase AmpD
MRTYTVRAGDTLGKIARKFSVSMDGIVRLNNIPNPDRIRVGTTLRIPELTTDGMDAVPLPVEPPLAPGAVTSTIPINRSRFVLPTKEFFPEVVEKDLIVLHFTAGQSAQSAFNTWMNNPERVATAYIVDSDGTIYELFDPCYWAYHLGVKGTSAHDRRSIGVEIANVGPLKQSPSDTNRLDWWPNNWGTPWCRLDEAGRYVRTRFRGIDYFASFPEPQVTSVARLAAYLCERFGVPKNLPARTRRKECDTSYYATRKGVVPHQNFRPDKWDVGPAFDWERLGI